MICSWFSKSTNKFTNWFLFKLDLFTWAVGINVEQWIFSGILKLAAFRCYCTFIECRNYFESSINLAILLMERSWIKPHLNICSSSTRRYLLWFLPQMFRLFGSTVFIKCPQMTFWPWGSRWWLFVRVSKRTMLFMFVRGTATTKNCFRLWPLGHSLIVTFIVSLS